MTSFSTSIKASKKYKFSLNILPLSDYQEVLFPETVTTTLTNWKEIPSPSSELTQGLLTPNFWPNRKVQPRRHSKNFPSTGHNTNKLLFHSCFNLKNSFRFSFFFSPIFQLIKHLINQVLVQKSLYQKKNYKLSHLKTGCQPQTSIRCSKSSGS